MESLTPEYFETVYEAKDDPWNFATSEYEAAKYEATIAALPKLRYQSGFEIGCSIGILTRHLAAHCKTLLSVDVNEKALAQARVRCSDLPQVHFAKMIIPQDFPAEQFDLIMVSEVGYYLSPQDWSSAIEKLIDHLVPGGHIILVHWVHYVEDYPQSGNLVHESFAEMASGRIRHLKADQTEDYRIDIWEGSETTSEN